MIHKYKLNIIALLFVLPLFAQAQEPLQGIVLEVLDGEEVPLTGANVYWLNTSIGTMTDEEGKFSVPYSDEHNQLVISFIGFKTETLTVNSNTFIRQVLQSTSDLDEVKLSAQKQTTAKSYLKATNTFTVTNDELLKAACCNLSESFETNPSIDVNFADAVTGTRQIKMLGLTSPYILIATENIPAVRGASQAQGLSFIPGTWVESIQITKGAGSVINGFESITGQINA